MTTINDNEVATPSNLPMLTSQSNSVELYHALCDATVNCSKALDACRDYRKELDDKNNEVARLREINLGIDLRRIFEIAEWLASRAIVLEKTDKETLPKLRAELAELKARLAPAPEEPCPHAHIIGWCHQCGKMSGRKKAPAPEETQDGATMDEWYGGFSKIESTELDNDVAKLKEMVMDAAKRGHEMAFHWKERAEKAEAIIKQLHHFAGIIEGFQNSTK